MSSNITHCSDSITKASEFLIALTDWERTVCIVCGCLCCISLLLLVDNVVFIWTHHTYRMAMLTSLWLVALSPILTVIAVAAMLVPKMFVFRDVVMSVCLSVVMYKFLEMLIALGDQFDSIRHEIIHHQRLQFNVRPLCCLFSCLPTAKITKTSFLIMKMLVLQHPIIIVLVTLITMVTWLDGTYVIGKWITDNPFPYLSALRVTSVLIAIYALSSLVTVCKYAMKDLYVSQKYTALSVTLFLFSVQGVVFDVLTSKGVFDFRQCLSGRTMRNFYENSLYCVQMFLVTVVNVFYYRRPLNPPITITSHDHNQNKTSELHENHHNTHLNGVANTSSVVTIQEALTQTFIYNGDFNTEPKQSTTETSDRS